VSVRISTFAAPLQQEYLLQSLNTQLNTLTQEASTGVKADPAGSMGQNASELYQLQIEADQQNELQTTTTTVGNQLTAMQDALTSMASTVQPISTATINSATTTPEGQTALGEQASAAMEQVLNLLNTQYGGSALFAGDATGAPPMQSANATGGPADTINTILNDAVAANGGQPITSTNVSTLLNNLASVFNNTNSNPSLNYNQSFYTAADDGNATQVLIGTNQTISYSVKGDQPAFTDLLQGLSMLSMLSAPATQLDSTAKSAILSQATTLIGQAQNELTTTQGQVGTVQAQLQQVSDAQQTAASNTNQQISSLQSVDMTATATQLSNLQTQLEASYQVTSQLSQLNLSHFLPSLVS
jgi:flagellar hook-associated protein 3 FlgL